MNKSAIKEAAQAKGFTLIQETDTYLSFSRTGIILWFDSERNILAMIISGEPAYNFVTSDSIDKVSLFLISKT